MPWFTRFSKKYIFLKKSEIWAKHGQLTINTIALNFWMEYSTTECSVSFGKIRFLKRRDVNNSNFWFLAILYGFSQGLSLFKQILFS